MRCARCTSDGADESGLCPACRTASEAPTSPRDVTVGGEAPPSLEGEPTGPTQAALGRAETRPQFRPGDAFGDRYLIVERVGGGGMGEVYKAIDRQLDRTVALKLLRPGLESRPTALQRFRRELGHALAVTHSNVCRVHDLGEVEGTAFISMEFVPGQTLHDLIRSVGRLSPRQTITIGRQVCAGLQAIHDRGIVHRDLKPSNVMVDPNGHAVVMDFGLAHQPGEEPVTADGSVLGTLAYLSPEQARSRPTEARSDLYTAGLILFEMLTGRRPPADDVPLPLALREPHETCPPPSRLSPEVPPALDAVVLRCLDRDPSRRFATASALERALAAIDAGTTTDVALPAPSTSRAVALPARYGRLALAALGLAAAGVAVWQAGSGGAPPRGPSDRAVVAVLPLDNLGGDPADEHLGAGLADALVTALASSSSLTVVSRSSTLEESRRLRGTREVARELGVTFLVGGGVQRLGESVRFTLNLIRPDATVAWGESYEDRLANLWTLQHRAAEDLRAALLPGPGERRPPPAPPTAVSEALEEYSRGRALLERPDVVANVARAVSMFESAARRDPKFALARAGLAEALWARYDETRDAAFVSRAQDVITEALTIDAAQPGVRSVLARVYYGTGRVPQAIDQLREVTAILPSNDEAHALLGRILSEQGRTEEAVVEIQKAIDLRPRFWGHKSALGRVYFRRARYDKAAAAFEEATRLQPDNSRPFQQLGAAYQAMGDDDRALESYRRALRLGPDARAHSNVGLILYSRGRYDEAAIAFEEALRLEPGSPRKLLNLGDAYARLGRTREARAAYERGVESGRGLLRVNARDPVSRADLALLEAKLGRHSEALRHAKEAADLLPGDGDILHTQATVLALAGRRGEAVEALRQALDSGYGLALARRDDDLARALADVPAFKDLLARPQ